MRVAASSDAGFRLFKDFGDVAPASAQPAVRELYSLLAAMRQAVRQRDPVWASYPTITEYARVCFWAIRKLEYSFATEAFAALESQAGRPLAVLDVGCGVVPVCNWISRRGHQVTAVDPSESDITFLVGNDLNAFYGSDVTYEVARSEQLRFPDNSFDVVTCISVLEHLAPGNDRVALWEMARVLKPDGHLIVTFDVSPPREPQGGEAPWPPDRRRYAEPFPPQAAVRLLDHIAPVFDVSSSDVAGPLARLTWREVRRFWEASAQQDERPPAARDYLAFGAVLKRRPGPVARDPTKISAAYLEGQAALEERLAFHQEHALARLQILQRLEASQGRRWRLLGRLRALAAPQLGVLNQYPPRPLRIPKHYGTVKPPTPAVTISIVTPSLNQAHLLERTMRSVVSQGYPALQYIVQDGGSIDATPTVLERYRPALAHVDSRRDNGHSHTLDLGFGHATGEVMAWLDPGDLLLPGALNYVARFFAEHPGVDVVYGHRIIIDANDAEVGRWLLPPHDAEVLSWADYVPQETLFWRRRAWAGIGAAVDVTLRFAVDWDLLLRFRDAGARMHRVPRFLGAFRLRPQWKTSSEIDEARTREMQRLRERCHGRPVTQDEIDRAVSRYVRRHFVLDKAYRLLRW